MKKLFELTRHDFVNIAKMIDNNFINNKKISINMNKGLIKVIGHTEGGQCINCEVQIIIDYQNNILKEVLIDDEDGLRPVHEKTLSKVESYLKENNFLF